MVRNLFPIFRHTAFLISVLHILSFCLFCLISPNKPLNSAPSLLLPNHTDSLLHVHESTRCMLSKHQCPALGYTRKGNPCCWVGRQSRERGPAWAGALQVLHHECVLSALLSPSSTLRPERVAQTLPVISSWCLHFPCEFKHSNIMNMKHKHSTHRGMLMRFNWVQHVPLLTMV